jgi:hypothetical protein
MKRLSLLLTATFLLVAIGPGAAADPRGITDDPFGDEHTSTFFNGDGFSRGSASAEDVTVGAVHERKSRNLSLIGPLEL